MAYDSTYSAYASIAGGSGYDSTYSAMKAAAVALGAEDKNYDSEYSIAVELATLAESGQIGGGSGNSDPKVDQLLSNLSTNNYLNFERETGYLSSIREIYAFGEIYPRMEGFRGYGFPEVTYNSVDSTFEYIKNMNGEDAVFIKPYNYIVNYQSKIDSSEYKWYNPQGGGAIPKNGDLIPNYIPYMGNPSIRRVDEMYTSQLGTGQYEYDGWGDTVWPLPNLEFVEGLELELERSGSGEDVYYSDQVASYSDQIKGVFSAIPSGYAIGSFGNRLVENDINLKAIAYTRNDNDSAVVSWYQLYSYNNKQISVSDTFVNVDNLPFRDIENSFSAYDLPVDLKCNLVVKDDDTISAYFTNTGYKSIDITDLRSTHSRVNWDFGGCKNLKSVKFNSPVEIGYGMQSVQFMFGGCTNLVSIPVIDCGDVVGGTSPLTEMYSNSTYEKLTTLGGFKNLKIGWSWGFLDYCPNLTVQSLMNVIDNLYDLTANGLSGQTLKFGSTNLNKLTADQIAIATNKGWTLN